jgi:hypothetical protein
MLMSRSKLLHPSIPSLTQGRSVLSAGYLEKFCPISYRQFLGFYQCFFYFGDLRQWQGDVYATAAITFLEEARCRES